MMLMVQQIQCLSLLEHRPRISNPIDNDLSVPCPEIMGNLCNNFLVA